MNAFRLPTSWPAPADERASAIFAERVGARAAELATSAPETPDPITCIERAADAGLLACLGGNSPYLADLAVREIACLVALVCHGPDAVVAEVGRTLAAIDPRMSRAAIASALRRAKRRVALATAFADLGGLWTLGDVTAALTELAVATLRLAVDHLVLEHDAARRNRPQRPSGFSVIGMGKLGAGELNYSSDIDLVLIYDPDAIDPEATGRAPQLIAHALVALMQTRDDDGYVFRVDLRLRPDPAATPPAVAFLAALSYYESHGETWERAAMSKARPVAGDLALGARFLEGIAPFIWRRHLDFAVIDDMRAMKARIDRHRNTLPRPPGTTEAGDPVTALLGRDLKLGRGGIREIEFTVQTLQLVWGGREPGLRARGTLDGLRGLAQAGRIGASDADALACAYVLLRQAEHRLQMIADRQTHTLPADQAGFARFARFMGETDAPAFARRLSAVMETVHRQFDALLAIDDGAPVPPAWDVPAPYARAGFANPASASDLVAGWRVAGTGMRGPAVRTTRTARLLDRILATLIPALGRQRDPDLALARFDRLMARLSSSVEMLSLLARNPGLVERIADLLGMSGSLAEHLAVVPSAIEGLLAREDVDPDPRRTLVRELAGRRDGFALEVAIETTRRFVRGEEFRLALGELNGQVDVDRAGMARTALAVAAIGILFTRVRASHRARHGDIPGGGMAVVALGRAGSRAMMGASDLDLMLIYDHAADTAGIAGGGTGGTGSIGGTGGTRRLAPATYYTRLAQDFIRALTAPGVEGALYAVDMRLRPSGGKGPVAVSLASFQAYHAHDAWTWERMALTRARVVAGGAPLARRVRNAIAAALDKAGDAQTIRDDAVAMRTRLLRERPPEGRWDVRMREGGLLELEFIAQALQLGPLRHGSQRGGAARPPARRDQSTRRALAGLAAAGVLDRGEAAALIAADRFWRTLLSLLRILGGQAVPQEPWPAAMRDAVEAVCGNDIEEHAARHAATVRAAFERHLGPLPAVADGRHLGPLPALADGMKHAGSSSNA